jgi:hypothetical protein
VRLIALSILFAVIIFALSRVKKEDDDDEEDEE